MTKRINRVGATLLAFGLILGGTAGIATIPAIAAPPTVAPLGVVATFQGVPTAATLTSGSTFTVDNLGSGAIISTNLEVAPAATPTAFSPYFNYGTGNADSSGAINYVVNTSIAPVGFTGFATGDVLSWTVSSGSNNINYKYVVPAVGSLLSIEPVVTMSSTTQTPQSIFAGVPVTYSDLDTQKVLLIETAVSRFTGGSYQTPVVVNRTYVNPSSFTGNTYTANISAFDENDTSLQLNVNDAVLVTATSGAGVHNNGSDTTFLTAPVVTTNPAGSFFIANLSATQLFSGAVYNFTDLDSSFLNSVYLDYAPAATPFTFTNLSILPISASDITNGAASINAQFGTPTTPTAKLSQGDVVRVRLSTDGNTPVVMTTYVVPAPPVLPGTPAGNFAVTTPTAAQLFTGTQYNFSGLTASSTNRADIWVAPSADPLNFVNVTPSGISIPSSSIIGGVASVTASAYYAGTPNLPLNGGDIVQVRLTVDAMTPVTLSTSTIPTVPVIPTNPAGAFSPSTPTAAELLAGVDYNLINVDPAATNIVTVWGASAATPTVFTQVGTGITIPATDVTNGSTSITLSVYYTGTPKIALNGGDIVQVRLAVNGAPTSTLTNYVVPSVPGTTAASYNPKNPTAANFITGANLDITNLNAAATNTVKVYIKTSDGTYVLAGTTVIPTTSIANGSYSISVFAYLTKDGGVTKTELPAGSVVRVSLTVDSNAEVILSDYTIAGVPSTNPPAASSEKGGKLAATGTNDDAGLSSTLVAVMGSSLAIGSIMGGIVLLRRRKAVIE